MMWKNQAHTAVMLIGVIELCFGSAHNWPTEISEIPSEYWHVEWSGRVRTIMEVSIPNIHFQSWLFFFLDKEAIACLDREEPE